MLLSQSWEGHGGSGRVHECRSVESCSGLVFGARVVRCAHSAVGSDQSSDLGELIRKPRNAEPFESLSRERLF
jgi:hypothetical protein